MMRHKRLRPHMETGSYGYSRLVLRDMYVEQARDERYEHEQWRLAGTERWLTIRRGPYTVRVWKQYGAWNAWVEKCDIYGRQTPCCEVARLSANARDKPSRGRARRAGLRWLEAVIRSERKGS